MTRAEKRRLRKLNLVYCFLLAAAMVAAAFLSVGAAVNDQIPPADADAGTPEPVILTAMTSPTVTWTHWVRYPVPLEDDLQRYIGEICSRYHVPTEMVMALMDPESGYDAGAIGDSGQSFGLMQVWATEHTGRCIELECYNLLNPYQNVLVGVDFLAELWDSYGNWEQALSFYHGEGGDLPSAYADDILAKAEILAEGASIETLMVAGGAGQ